MDTEHDFDATTRPLLPSADHLEVLNLYARYNHTLDAGQAQAWAACFTTDGRLEIPVAQLVVQGSEALAAFAVSSMERTGGKDRHLTTSVEIVGADTGALGRSYLVMKSVGPDGAPTHTFAGRYADSLLKTPEGWRFVRRTLTPD